MSKESRGQEIEVHNSVSQLTFLFSATIRGSVRSMIASLRRRLALSRIKEESWYAGEVKCHPCTAGDEAQVDGWISQEEWADRRERICCIVCRAQTNKAAQKSCAGAACPIMTIIH
ncbi:hypothetical protein AMECASPLE_022841 [Ameca splendens]|uniref:Uncharacterized protein n=1 Tax=Ameca splendens TaxID=208324 RepID=A0ABV0Z3L3_9TELE